MLLVAAAIAGAGAATLRVSVSAATSSAAPIVGSGHVITKSFPVTPFSRLDVHGPFDIRVSIGTAEKVTAHVDDNIVDTLDIAVHGQTLRVALKPGTSIRNVTLEVDVTVRSLGEIDGAAAARIRLLDELQSQSLALVLKGASRLDGRVVTVTGRLELAGASRASVSGSATNLDVSAMGASGLDAKELTVGALDIDLAGASRAVATVTNSLSAALAGASSLRYVGTPTITRRSVTGASLLAPAA
jgi:hypothetical protein